MILKQWGSYLKVVLAKVFLKNMPENIDRTMHK